MEQQKKRCQNALDKKDFVTSAVISVKHSVAHRLKTGETVKTNKEGTEPNTLGPLDLSLAPRTEGTTVLLCGDSNVSGKMDQWGLREETGVQG